MNLIMNKIFNIPSAEKIIVLLSEEINKFNNSLYFVLKLTKLIHILLVEKW